jgi:hypothetical protein
MSKPLTEGSTMGGMSPKKQDSAFSMRPPMPRLMTPKTKMSLREQDWLEFSDRVAKHLREYTVPQYGDKPDDEISRYSVEVCVEAVAKYAKRYDKQSRQGQQELDFVKMAHYAQCAWEKYNKIPVIHAAYKLIPYDTKWTEEDVAKNSGMEYIGKFTFNGAVKYVYKELV